MLPILHVRNEILHSKNIYVHAPTVSNLFTCKFFVTHIQYKMLHLWSNETYLISVHSVYTKHIYPL